MNDPTIDKFVINTRERGKFSEILQLVSFNCTDIEIKNIGFVSEVLEILNNDSINIIQPTQVELTTDNVIKLLQKHEEYNFLYIELFESRIEYASAHFNELLSSHKEGLISLEINTLERIISNEKLQLDDEDEFLDFINELFKRDVRYSIFYEYVYFNNVNTNAMTNFVSTFEMKYLNGRTWERICERLIEEVNSSKKIKEKHHEVQGQMFSPNQNDPFSGIINHLRNKSNNHIEQEIEVTPSSIGVDRKEYQPQTVLLKENPNYHFHTKNIADSWIKLDFKEHQIIPTDYTI